MSSPLIRLNAGAFHHLPYTFIGLNLLWCLSRGRSDLTFLSSSPSYEIQTFSYPSIWFPHWLGSEDHTRPWFYPKLVIFLFCTWFPHRLESEDHARPWFSLSLSSGISQVAKQEVVLGKGYSSAWAVVRGPPCRTGLGREFTRPTN